MSQLTMLRPNLDDLPELSVFQSGSQLRPFRDDEAEALASLLAISFDRPWTEGGARTELLNHPDVTVTYGIFVEGKAAATASALLMPLDSPGTGWLHWVGVDPAYRGQRLGRLVSLAVLHSLRETGCTCSRLKTDDFRISAIKTYLGLGYEAEMTDTDHDERWAEIRRQIAGPAS